MCVAECVALCAESGVSGIRAGTHCVCLDSVPGYFTPGVCDVQCVGDSTALCGGDEHYDVYSTGNN